MNLEGVKQGDMCDLLKSTLDSRISSPSTAIATAFVFLDLDESFRTTHRDIVLMGSDRDSETLSCSEMIDRLLRTSATMLQPKLPLVLFVIEIERSA